jgi:hypothetical protein
MEKFLTTLGEDLVRKLSSEVALGVAAVLSDGVLEVYLM